MTAIDTPPSPRTSPLDFSRRTHTSPDEIVVEARADGAVIGCACCDLQPATATGHVTVSVSPEWRNQHIGRELLERIVAEASEVGLDYLVGRYPALDAAATRMLAGSDCVVARRTGDGMVRFAVSVPPR